MNIFSVAAGTKPFSNTLGFDSHFMLLNLFKGVGAGVKALTPIICEPQTAAKNYVLSHFQAVHFQASQL